MLPLVMPAIAAFGIFQFLWVWNDLLVALVFAGGTQDVAPLTVRLAELQGNRGGDRHLLSAGAFVSIIVPVIVFLALQRYFVRGLLAGSVAPRTGPRGAPMSSITDVAASGVSVATVSRALRDLPGPRHRRCSAGARRASAPPLSSARSSWRCTQRRCAAHGKDGGVVRRRQRTRSVPRPPSRVYLSGSSRAVSAG